MLSDLCNTNVDSVCQIDKRQIFLKNQNMRPSARRRASWVLSDLYRLADWSHKNGLVLNDKDWLHVLAGVLTSATPGPIVINFASAKCGRWKELDFENLTMALARCKIEATEEQIMLQIHRTLKWRAKKATENGLKAYTAPLSSKYIGQKLGITSIMRHEAKAHNIMAIDETKEDREERRKRLDREYQAKARRERGVKPRKPAQEPWKDLGISRSAYYRRRKSQAKINAKHELNEQFSDIKSDINENLNPINSQGETVQSEASIDNTIIIGLPSFVSQSETDTTFPVETFNEMYNGLYNSIEYHNGWCESKTVKQRECGIETVVFKDVSDQIVSGYQDRHDDMFRDICEFRGIFAGYDDLPLTHDKQVTIISDVASHIGCKIDDDGVFGIENMVEIVWFNLERYLDLHTAKF